MFGLCCRRLQLLLVPRCSIAVDYSVIHFRSIQSNSLLGAQIDGKGPSFTVSYLINSCGLSPELALSLSKKQRVHFKSPEKPDSIIKLLKHYGFNETHISQIVKKCPRLLSVNAQKTLFPKLEFFGSIGVEGTGLVQLVCSNPRVLINSLEGNLRPWYDMIKSPLLPVQKISIFFRNAQWVLSVKTRSNVASNVSVLRALEVPESSISASVITYPYVMSRDTDKFKENVNKVICLGILPSSATFLKALDVIFRMGTSKWEHKRQLCRKIGWTEEDFSLAFRKNPMFMTLSDRNFSSKIDFLVNKMGLQPADMADNPTALTYSLETWIIPRCAIITLLQLKGFITKGEFSVGTMLQSSKAYFLKRFVIQYQEQVPELLNIFQGNMGLGELGIGFAERSGTE